jgi:hypothetical protein
MLGGNEVGSSSFKKTRTGKIAMSDGYLVPC